MSSWIKTGLGQYDISTLEGSTYSTIDIAYDSYDTVIRHLLWEDISLELRKQLNQMANDYYRYQLPIDIRQNVEPVFEKPEKTILKACQYAQASLMRDLRRVYASISKVPSLKNRVDEILRVNPKGITLQLSPPGTNFSQFEVSYIDIRDPESAASIIGVLNSTDKLLDKTAHCTLMDNVLEKLISEATVLDKEQLLMENPKEEPQTALKGSVSNRKICPKCGYQNPLYRVRCKNCDKPLPDAP